MSSLTSPTSNKASTVAIYSLIRDGKYTDAVAILSHQLTQYPKSRAALSLLAYCYYYLQDFPNAAIQYELLTRYVPESYEYRMYYAQCLYKAGEYEQAARIAANIADMTAGGGSSSNVAQYAFKMLHLQAAIKYEQNELAASKSFIDQSISDAPDTIVARGCIAYKEGQYDVARSLFQEAMNMLGYQADISYNIALCFYKQKSYNAAMKFIDEIIDRGVKEHPELGVGSRNEGIEVRSVGNSQILKETALIEAFNLKAAIEFSTKNNDAARASLLAMPPRDESELDPVSLHNNALMNMDSDPSGGFKKLQFLLSQPPFPPETFGNLLLLYIKFGYYDLAADVLAEHVHLHETCLNNELYEYLEASILTQSAPAEAYRKFDFLSTKHIDTLRRLTKTIQDARHAHDSEATKAALSSYDEALEKYIPVLMAAAKIYWDLENYAHVEKLFKSSAEFCSEHEIWKLNLAHVFFMQEGKYKDAIKYYAPAVRKYLENNAILEVTASVLANLCVSYIMTAQNEEAEELMRQIEKEEERESYENPTKQYYHLCIVNLVIGTLYCAKGNFEFGISRIIKSLEPYNKKLGADTWYYAKRCFLAVMETLSKHMMIFKDEFFVEIMNFLDECDKLGAEIMTMVPSQGQTVDPAIHNVQYEARLLKKMFYKLRD